MNKYQIMLLIYMIVSVILTLAIVEYGKKKNDQTPKLFEIVTILVIAPAYTMAVIIFSLFGNIFKALKKSSKHTGYTGVEYCLVTIISKDHTLNLLYRDAFEAEAATEEYRDAHQTDVDAGDTKFCYRMLHAEEVIQRVGLENIMNILIDERSMS